MKRGNKHGIVKCKCEIPKDGYRLVPIFRFLQPHIKKQALHHKDFCKNMDTDENVMNKCRCHLVK